jgi:hypothetical protein
MRSPQSVPAHGAREDRWVDALLEGARETVRAPRGFAQKVMDAVYRESLAGRSPAEAARGISLAAAARASRPMVSRMYRRLGLSFMLTAAVLAASLLVPHGAYSTLIGGGSDTALGAGPSAAVQNVLVGARHAVQGALGEQQIGGNQE